MQRFTRRLCAAIAAVLGIGGMASAQNGQPNPLPAIPIPPAQAVQQIPFQPILPNQVQSVPFQPILPIQAATIAPQPVNTTVSTATNTAGFGCSNCGNSGGRTGANPYLPKNAILGAGLAPVPYAEYCSQCANGCGSLKSNIGFYLGSSKSFFNPCGPVPCNIWGSSSICQKCGVFPYGKPYGTGFNTCNYDSYMNH